MKQTTVFLLWVMLLGNLIACTEETVSPDVFDSAAPEPTASIAQVDATQVPTPTPNPTAVPLPTATPTEPPIQPPVEEPALEVVTPEPSDGAFGLTQGEDEEETPIATEPISSGPFTLVSVAEGNPLMDTVESISVSGDGRFVAFTSGAEYLFREPHPSGAGLGSLIEGVVPGTLIHDRLTGETSTLSFTGEYQIGNPRYISLSTNGRFVVFSSSGATDEMAREQMATGELLITPELQRENIYVYDRETSDIEVITPPAFVAETPPFNRCPVISGDGRFIAFESETNDLIENITSEKSQVYLYDRETQTMRLASHTPEGNPLDGNLGCPNISGDGTRVVFASDKGTFIYDISTEQLTVLDSNYANLRNPPTISQDGERITFQTFSGSAEIHVKDISTGQEWLISLGDTDLNQRAFLDAPAISADGNYVVFWVMQPTDNHKWAILRYDLEQERLEELYMADGYSGETNRTFNEDYNFRPILSVSEEGTLIGFISRFPLVEGLDLQSGSRVHLFVLDSSYEN